MLMFVLEIAWQYFFLSEEFGRVRHGFVFEKIGGFFSLLAERGLIGWAIFLVIFVVLFAFVFPAWIQSTLILSIRQKFTHPDRRLSIRQKIIEGFDYFFRLFEFHVVLAPFQIMTIVLFGLTMYRYYHGDIFNFMLPVIIGYGIFALFINLFFAYAPYYMVCEGEEWGPAMKKSVGLVFLNFGTTLGLILLMFLVNIRVVVNVLVVLGVPLGILAAASYFTTSVWFGFAVSVAVIIGIGLMVLAAYLTAVLEVFSIGFWERAFTTLRQEQRQLESPEIPK